jgi:hypothetical protein
MIYQKVVSDNLLNDRIRSTSYPVGLGILEVQFRGMTFARNSICFRGILFNVSSLSLWLPSRPLDRDISFRNCVIPRQTKSIVHGDVDMKHIDFIAFESWSHLTRIDVSAFSGVLGLRSICLPRLVDTICLGAFSDCRNLLVLCFERGSGLTRMEEATFARCRSLKSIHLPASLQFLDPNAFRWTEHDSFTLAKASQISIEEGSHHFRVWGGFLMDIEGATVVRYFGHDRNLTLSCEIETLGVGCFSRCYRLSSLVFEGGSKLKRIEALAFSHCSELKSVCIPASVEILCRRCFAQCHRLLLHLLPEVYRRFKLLSIHSRTIIFRNTAQK